jgi:hypothetical protein
VQSNQELIWPGCEISIGLETNEDTRVLKKLTMLWTGSTSRPETDPAYSSTLEFRLG